ncbi:MAG TPA: hypothetical protein DD670_00190 [Planctomycetaceae bacterium]|nr:hypothetical protein [Planctomycetaceae bacterium]
MESAITSEVGILAVLTGVSSFFFYLEHRTGWKLFDYLPPLLFIYAVPMVLANVAVFPVAADPTGKDRQAIHATQDKDGQDVDATLLATDDRATTSRDVAGIPRENTTTHRPLLPSKSPLYGWMDRAVLPFFLLLLLTNVDLVATVRVLGRGILVMLMGSAGVVLGAPIAYFLVKTQLGEDSWKAFAALSGSWIGGAGNMTAMKTVFDVPGSAMGLAVLGDTLIYLIWIPLLLTSKGCTSWFNRFTRVDPKRSELLEDASKELPSAKGEFKPRHVLYWLFIGLAGTWFATSAATWMPVGTGPWSDVLTTNTWTIFFITLLGIALSFTPVRRVPGTHEVATAFVFLFMANVGATADLKGLAGEAPWFIAAAFFWIIFHGLFCILGARVLHVDLQTTAIASAANIGGVATASIVAEHHNDRLVPAAVLMAMLGYAIGNFGAYAAGWLCKLVS